MQEELQFWLSEETRLSPAKFETFHIALYNCRLNLPTAKITVLHQAPTTPNPQWQLPAFRLKKVPAGTARPIMALEGLHVPSKPTAKLPTRYWPAPAGKTNLQGALDWLSQLASQPAGWIALLPESPARTQWLKPEQQLTHTEWQDWIWSQAPLPQRNHYSGNFKMPKAPQPKTTTAQ
jgi:hypothetical protein